MTLGEVQKVLQLLLREQVSIRDLGTILETLVETAATNKHPVALVEAVQAGDWSRAGSSRCSMSKVELKVVTLDGAIEEECMHAGNPQSQNIVSGAQQLSLARRVLEGLRKMFGEQILSAPPVLLCSSPARFHLRRLLEPFVPRVVVIAPS